MVLNTWPRPFHGAYLTEHFRSIAIALLRAGAWLVILSAIFVPLERLFALHPQKISRKEVAVDIGYYFLNALVVALVLGPPVAIIAFVMRHVVPGSVVGTLSAWPIWARACAAIVVGETGYLLGASLDPQDPVSLAFPRRAPQRRIAQLSREFSRAPG
jgi:sterol desaturase/sphingolipid hydroxylase (fatty acid hydroxylase superfamily)